MAALQHVKSHATVCLALRQMTLLPKLNFSVSNQLLGKNRKQAAKVTLRFADVEPKESLVKKRIGSNISSQEQQPAVCRAVPFNASLVSSLLRDMENDLPIADMSDPYVKDYARCYLCTNDVKIDYKNVRLLSQFVSPYTGRIYGRAVTGLCIPMQKHVAFMIRRSRATGFMPVINKDPRYLQDPQPFNPMAKQMS